MSFLTQYAPYIPDNTWTQIAEHQKLTEEFIVDFHYFLPIRVLLKHQKVHQSTIENNIYIFADYMWHVCRYQYLTMKFMDDHKDIIHWPNAFKFQTHISQSFIIKHFDRISDGYIYNINNLFSHKVLHKHRNIIEPRIEKHNEKIRIISSVKSKRKL